MKKPFFIGLVLLSLLTACHSPRREARRMVKRAERLADILPDSSAHLIDSVLRMEVYYTERQRMEMAMLQGEALFRDVSFEDDLGEALLGLITSPDLERAANYYAHKNHYAKAGHAALYSGYVQQTYHEKDKAMQSYKQAEQYAALAHDSLTLMQAQYYIGRLLYDDGMKNDAIVLFKASAEYEKARDSDKSLIQNAIACCYLLKSQPDSAEICLQQSLAYAENVHSYKARQKALNNLAVLYRLQGKYDKALACLQQMAKEPGLDETKLLMLDLNRGKIWMSQGNMDSASYYLKRLESVLPEAKVIDETKVSAYSSLAQLAKYQHDDSLALLYQEKHDMFLFEVMQHRQAQSIYRIGKQFDYESLQNASNQKIIRRHRIILMLSVLSVLIMVALMLSQIRLAKIRKREVETKNNLFHFMQQNMELKQKNEAHRQNHLLLRQQQQRSEQAYDALLQEYEALLETQEESEQRAETYGNQWSQSLMQEQSTMLRLYLFIKNKGDDDLLKKLETAVFGQQKPWEAIVERVDQIYPQLRATLKHEQLGLNEVEQQDVILSYFNISRSDEALLLGKTTDMVDKIRKRAKDKIQAASGVVSLPPKP